VWSTERLRGGKKRRAEYEGAGKKESVEENDLLFCEKRGGCTGGKDVRMSAETNPVKRLEKLRPWGEGRSRIPWVRQGGSWGGGGEEKKKMS